MRVRCGRKDNRAERKSAWPLIALGMGAALASCHDRPEGLTDPSSLRPPAIAYFDAWCSDYSTSECEPPIYDGEMSGAMGLISNEEGEIEEDNVVVTCDDLYDQFITNWGLDMLNEYVGSYDGWDGYATYDGDGAIFRRSYLAGSPSSSELYSLLLHEHRHNLGHDHGDQGSYTETTDEEAATICGSISPALSALSPYFYPRDFVSYLNRFASLENL